MRRSGEGAPKAAPTAKGAVSRGVSASAKCGRYHERPTIRNRLKLRALGPAGPFAVIGQNANALLALIRAGTAGVTALEVNSWAYRFGAYVHVLRHRHGLAIEMIREAHNDAGDWHGRYVLRSPVSILEPTP